MSGGLAAKSNQNNADHANRPGQVGEKGMRPSPLRGASVRDVLRSQGQPLDPAVRAFMAERFGRDFQHVRVHTDPQAAETAADVAAKAYTVGHHIVFKTGEYAPDTTAGRRSIAHELAHVVQQGRGGGSAPGLDANHSLEHSADHAADQAMQGSGSDGAVQVAGSSAPGLARQEDDTPWWKRGLNRAKELGSSAVGSVRSAAGSVKQLVAANNEMPTVDEAVAGAIQKAAEGTDANSKSGAFVRAASSVATAAAKVASVPRRAFVRTALEGKPIQAVKQWQAEMDTSLKELKESVHAGVEAYEDGKFGNPVPYVMAAANPIVGGAIAGADKLTGGKASEAYRQVQGGLVKSLYSMGEGLVNVAVHPVRTVEGLSKVAEMGSPAPSRDTMANAFGFVKDLVDPKLTTSQAAQNYLRAEEAKHLKRQEEGKQLLEGLGENYISAWKKERYGEIPGLLIGDVGSFFTGGGAAAKGAGTGAKAAGTLGKVGRTAEVAGNVGKTAGVAGRTGEVAKAADVAADLGRAAEAAKPVTVAEEAAKLGSVAEASNLTPISRGRQPRFSPQAQKKLDRAPRGVKEPTPIREAVPKQQPVPQEVPAAQPAVVEQATGTHGSTWRASLEGGGPKSPPPKLVPAKPVAPAAPAAPVAPAAAPKLVGGAGKGAAKAAAAKPAAAKPAVAKPAVVTPLKPPKLPKAATAPKQPKAPKPPKTTTPPKAPKPVTTRKPPAPKPPPLMKIADRRRLAELQYRSASIEAGYRQTRTRLRNQAKLKAGQNVGPSRGMNLAFERKALLDLARKHPERIFLEQVELVGVNKHGVLETTKQVSPLRKGRAPDFAEVSGKRVDLGEFKSPDEHLRSISGGVQEGPISATYNPESKLGKQLRAEQAVVDRATEVGGTIVVRGKDVVTGVEVVMHVEVKNFGKSRVLPYKSPSLGN